MKCIGYFSESHRPLLQAARISVLLGNGVHRLRKPEFSHGIFVLTYPHKPPGLAAVILCTQPATTRDGHGFSREQKTTERNEIE